MGLNERITLLEEQLSAALKKIEDLSKNVEETYKKPISIVGGLRDKSTTHPSDPGAGLGQAFGGMMVWNDAELKIPPYGEVPPTPTKGYGKHTHTRFSGGALMKDYLEIVEYDTGEIINPHSQAFLSTEPTIKKVINSSGESVDKIGLLDLTFNADTGLWSTAAAEIDINKCYLVERDASGNIATDENGNQKKSLLYNTDENKTSIIWDKNAQVWRFLAVYAGNE